MKTQALVDKAIQPIDDTARATGKRGPDSASNTWQVSVA